MRTLVVGASGILAPLAAELATLGDAVTGIARRRPVPRGVEPLPVDARSVEEVAAAVGSRAWDRAVVYAGATTEETRDVLRNAVSGRFVTVLTSAWAAPGRPPVPRRDILLLGWHDDGDGDARWHTPEEVSRAALEVLLDEATRTLGATRLWERRPA